MEAVTRSCSIKKVLLKFLQNSQESISAGVSFLKKLTKRGNKKGSSTVFSREFCKIYRNTNFKECLQTAAITKRFCGGVLL